MTASKHLKQLVRARMARTGESSTSARQHVVGRAAKLSLTPAFVVAGHGRHGQAVTFSPDGTMLASGGQDTVITPWAVPGWEPLRRFDVGARASAVTISPDGRLLAVAWDGHVGLWTLEDDTPVDIAELPITGVYAVAFSPDGRRLAQTGADGRIRCRWLRGA